MTNADIEKLNYILKCAQTFTPLKRIMSDFRKLSGRASEDEVQHQLTQWEQSGHCISQAGYLPGVSLYRLTPTEE